MDKMDASCKDTIKALVQRLRGVFDEEDALRVKAKLDSHNGFVNLSNFKEVMTEFFEEPDSEQPKIILSTPLLLECMFKFMDTQKDGKIDFVEFCVGAARLFSGESEDQASVHVALYDPDQKGTITREAIVALVQPVIRSLMKYTHEDPESVVDKERFAKAQAMAEGERGTAILIDGLTKAFRAAGVSDGCSLTHAQFVSAFIANPDAFHFRDLSHDVVDAIEEEVQRRG